MKHAEMRAALAACPTGTHLHATLAAVLLHIGDEGQPCAASTETLANVAGCSKRNARRNIDALVTAGQLVAVEVAGKPTLLTYGGTPATSPELEGGRRRPRTPMTPVADDPGHGRPQGGSPATPEGLEGESTLGYAERSVVLTAPEEPETPRARARARRPREVDPVSLLDEFDTPKLPTPNDWIEAVIEASARTSKELTPRQRGRIARGCKALIKDGASLDDVERQATALKVSWRGRVPEPWQIVENWNPQLPAHAGLDPADRWSATHATS